MNQEVAEIVEDDEEMNRRSSRLALSELNEVCPTQTPNKRVSPDEMVIIQRGPRKTPITWSPVEYDKKKILGRPREKTPEPVVTHRSEVSSKLRRRLIMTPRKDTSQDLGNIIAKKLRSLKSLDVDSNK